MMVKKDKRNKIIIIIFIIAFVLNMGRVFLPILNIGISQLNEEEKWLFTSVSPNKEYVLKAYKTEPGATVDFSIKVYLINKTEEKLIYNAYHEYDVEIIWKTENIVCINGRTLNLLEEETYDWRENY